MDWISVQLHLDSWMVLAPKKGEWGSTAVCEGKRSSSGMKFFKIKFGVWNISRINYADGHKLILLTRQPTPQEWILPRLPHWTADTTCKDNIIYIITRIRCSYRPKVLPYDTNESTAVALGLCILNSAWPHRCRPRNSHLLALLSVLASLHRNHPSCPMGLCLPSSYSVWAALTQCKINVHYYTSWGNAPG